MFVSALGLSEFATQHGGYPNGFISVADTHGYLIGISANNNDYMVRWQIAVICLNIVMGGNGE